MIDAFIAWLFGPTVRCRDWWETDGFGFDVGDWFP